LLKGIRRNLHAPSQRGLADLPGGNSTGCQHLANGDQVRRDSILAKLLEGHGALQEEGATAGSQQERQHRAAAQLPPQVACQGADVGPRPAVDVQESHRPLQMQQSHGMILGRTGGQLEVLALPHPVVAAPAGLPDG